MYVYRRGMSKNGAVYTLRVELFDLVKGYAWWCLQTSGGLNHLVFVIANDSKRLQRRRTHLKVRITLCVKV